MLIRTINYSLRIEMFCKNSCSCIPSSSNNSKGLVYIFFNRCRQNEIRYKKHESDENFSRIKRRDINWFFMRMDLLSKVEFLTSGGNILLCYHDVDIRRMPLAFRCTTNPAFWNADSKSALAKHRKRRIITRGRIRGCSCVWLCEIGADVEALSLKWWALS